MLEMQIVIDIAQCIFLSMKIEELV